MKGKNSTIQQFNNSTKKRGFTIVEILIAVVILGVGLVSIIALFPVAMDIHSKSTAIKYSVHIARSAESAIKTGRNQTNANSPSFRFVYDDGWIDTGEPGYNNEQGISEDISLPTDDIEYRYPSNDKEVYKIGRSIERKEGKEDPSSRYSFCFYIKRSPQDPLNASDSHCNILYEFTIYVYRNFNPERSENHIRRYKFQLRFK